MGKTIDITVKIGDCLPHIVSGTPEQWGRWIASDADRQKAFMDVVTGGAWSKAMAGAGAHQPLGVFRPIT